MTNTSVPSTSVPSSPSVQHGTSSSQNSSKTTSGATPPNRTSSKYDPNTSQVINSPNGKSALDRLGTAAKATAYVVIPSILNNYVGDASNFKATVSTVATGIGINRVRKRWEDMNFVGRALGSSAVGLFAANTMTGGYLEKGSFAGLAVGAGAGLIADRRAKAKEAAGSVVSASPTVKSGSGASSKLTGVSEKAKNAKEISSKGAKWVRDNLNTGATKLRAGWNGMSDTTRTALAGASLLGTGTFLAAELGEGFNHATSAASAFVVSGLTYGGFKYEGLGDGEKAVFKKRAIVAGAALASAAVIAGSMYVAHKHGFMGGNGASAHSDKLQDGAAKPKSGGGNGSIFGFKHHVPQHTPKGNRSGGHTTIPSTSIPKGGRSTTPTTGVTPRASVPRSGGGGSSTHLTPRAGGGNRGGGNSTGGKNSELVLKRIADAQKAAAKIRARKLGLKLNDKQAQRLIERRMANLFKGNPKNFEKFSHASAKAQQAFTDSDLKRIATA